MIPSSRKGVFGPPHCLKGKQDLAGERAPEELGIGLGGGGSMKLERHRHALKLRLGPYRAPPALPRGFLKAAHPLPRHEDGVAPR